MNRDTLRSEMAVSEASESQTYLSLTLALFRGIQEPLKTLYDRASVTTNRFTAITGSAIKANPRIIKTLRYCLAPVISQMRLGQLIGLGTTEGFEEQGQEPTGPQANQLAQWFNNYLDAERFPWRSRRDLSGAELGIAETYAKLWTVSLQSNQNTATQYRTRRKERQEQAIAAALEAMGLTWQERLGGPRPPRARRKPSDPPPQPRPRRAGGIDAVDDILPGCYVKEQKILGGSQKKQKSDLTVRPSDAPALFCIEAKAVGIRLDSTKRLKELNDKYTDWKGSSLPITRGRDRRDVHSHRVGSHHQAEEDSDLL